MKVVVAGAGAGKTTSMAKLVVSTLEKVKNGKIIYVITYTNSARDKIKDEIKKEEGNIPRQLKVVTIHSFLLKEVIYPFSHLIYGEIYKSASKIPLSSNLKYKARKKRELKDNHIIHVEDVTKIAKYLLCGKSRDNKKITFRREQALQMLSKYLDSIFVDESQDMDGEFSEVLTKLNSYNININLIGDPKQDLRNRGSFRNIIANNQAVRYKAENHRCPRIHVDLSNSYIIKDERQTPTKKDGVLQYLLESNANIHKKIENDWYDLAYIYQKNERFKTQKIDKKKIEDQLFYELKSLTHKSSSVKEKYAALKAYVLLRKTINTIKQKRNTKIIFDGIQAELALVMNRADKGKIGSAIDSYKETFSKEPGILVDSIDGIKGLEGYNCLFIVSTQLAPYLFKEKTTENKMMNYLYVGLTRSKRNLTIMVTNEVENKYGYKYIHNQFKALGIEELKSY